MCAPSPPPPPDLAGAAAAQGQANVDAARATAKLNNPQVVNPYGTQTVNYGGTFDQAGYDKALDGYNQALEQVNSMPAAFGMRDKALKQLEQFAPNKDKFFSGDPDVPTITQTFSPEQQALFDKSNQVKGLLGDLGITGAESLKGVVGKELDLSGAPAGGGSYEDTRRQVIDAMMSRANEDYGQQTDQSNSDLIAAGIRPGTKAYADRMQMIERSRNDARSQAEIAGGNAANQAFNMDTQRRKDAIAEILTARQTPLNEINALMSGSQVSNPFAVPGYSSSANVSPAPVFGATQAAGQYGTDVYNANVGSRNAMLGGIFDIGASAAIPYMFAASDRRLKSNIVRVGTHPLGIGIYEYDIFGHREVGVMAQELIEVMPDAVVTMPNGYMAVDYGRL